MPHAKCADASGSQERAATAARSWGCQPKKSVNNDAPETTCMPTRAAARVCTDFVHPMQGWEVVWSQDGICGRQQARMVMNVGVCQAKWAKEGAPSWPVYGPELDGGGLAHGRRGGWWRLNGADNRSTAGDRAAVRL
jgi:hypothetical protein